MAATSVMASCIDAVQSTIRLVGLKGLSNNQVYAFKFPLDRESLSVILPCVMVSLDVTPESNLGGTNERDDWGYPVLVTLVDASNQDNDVPRQLLEWREDIIAEFNNKRLTGVNEVYICRVEPRAILDLNLFRDQNLDVSHLVIRCAARMTRG